MLTTRLSDFTCAGDLGGATDKVGKPVTTVQDSDSTFLSKLIVFGFGHDDRTKSDN